MSGGHAHPSRPGEPTRESARVRHKLTLREGCLAEGKAPHPDDVLVLFDGAPVPKRVPARNLVFLDVAEAASNPGARP